MHFWQKRKTTVVKFVYTYRFLNVEMHLFLVLVQPGLGHVTVATVVTAKWQFPSMSPQMNSQISLVEKLLITVRAGMLQVPCMVHCLMAPVPCPRLKLFSAVGTDPLLFLLVIFIKMGL